MKKQHKLVIAFISAAIAVIAGCQTSPTSPAASAVATPDADHVSAPALMSAAPAKSAKGKAQLWAETCNRCHNARSPDSYSGNEWAIVMTHMRIRGNLTGEEQRAILQFLQAQ